MSDASLLLLLAGMAVVTFIPRYLPFFLADRLRLPSWLERCLDYVPIAVLTIIITQTVVFRDGQLDLSYTNPYLLSAIVAIVSALVQRRLFVTIAIGLLSYALFRFVLLS